MIKIITTNKTVVKNNTFKKSFSLLLPLHKKIEILEIKYQILSKKAFF